MGIALTHFLSLIVMRCSFLDSIYPSFLPPGLSSSINRMRELLSNLETVSTDLCREFPDRWTVYTKIVAYAADQILCKLQQLLLGKDAAMASNLPGQNKKLEEVGSSSFSCFSTDGFYTSFPSSSEINDEINWIIRILEELLVSGEIKIGYSGVLTYINPGLSEQEVGELLYSSNPSQGWSEKYKMLMKPSVLMDVPESVNGFFNPIYNRRLRQASPFTLITSLHLSGLSGFVELPRLPVLQSLRISGCKRLNAVSICEKLSAVEALEISCCPELTSLAGLNQLLSLRNLSLSFCFNLQFDLYVQLPPLLEYLDLTHCPSLEEWCQNAGLQNRKLDEKIESFQRSPPVGDSPVYGRENEKNSIIEFLSSDDFNRSNLTVVCIVGESGIGKTSLAHLIYSEERVLDSFDACMFITMTEKSDETRLIKKLIESVMSSPCPMVEADLLEELLIDELSGTKVFIVLDDAENENPCFWNRIVTILNHSTRGSVLLVTTESKDVAEVIGAMQTYYLDPLSDYYCWKIFCQHIFTGLSTNANTDLVQTGKQLLSKCQHNPLCIKVLAGLFVCSKNEESWAEILKTDLWDMDGFDGDTLPTLRVGYELLPNELKKCLHYCSLFPKDYVFAKQQIVCMWMSQGFIFPVEGKQPEEVGLQNFDELLLRGFFQHSPLHDVEEDKFIMHDLICALATNLSGNECPPTEDDLESIFENCFHFSLNPSKIQIDKMKPLIKEASDLQSFLALTTSSFQIRINFSILDISSSSDLFTKCINLRTLDLSCTDIVELPSSVGMLKQLRYLGVSNTQIRSIPRELCSLVNLQTLEAKDCQHLVKLPETMMELKNLRHLDVSKKSGCVKMMIGIGQLTNLQSLAVFCVGCEMPCCSIRELKDLNSLSSCLQIAGLENVTNGLDAEEAALHNKVHLNTLWLHWNDNRTSTESEESVTISEEVLNNLKPNPKIGELIIRNYRGNLFPTWMGDPSFTKLVSIILDKCLNCSLFPALGGLPSLRHLSVQKLYHLVRLENTESQFVSKNTPKFPSLETLNLWEMYDLEELFETSDRDFPCLHTLSISRCPMLKRVPSFSSLLNLSLYCCVKLPYLPDLPSLESLRIDGFQKIKSLELPNDLPALKKLEIRHCNELLLVKGLRKLPSLEKLNVVHCPKFDSRKNWKLGHSKPISTTRWFFPKEESTTQMEHQETSEPAEDGQIDLISSALTGCSATVQHSTVNCGLPIQFVPGTYSTVSAVTELEHSGTKPTRKRLYDTEEEEIVSVPTSSGTELEHSGTKLTRKRIYDTEEEEVKKLHVAKRDELRVAKQMGIFVHGGDVGIFDDNVESFPSNDDTDPREIFAAPKRSPDFRSGSDFNSRDVSASDASASSLARIQYPSFSQRPTNLRIFTFPELKTATNNFSQSFMVGEGGFWCVYRGTIRNSEDPVTRIEVAIKELNRKGLQGHKEWLNEVNVLGVVDHPNLVKLIGYCAEDDERGIQRLLVYEYMPNRSVDDHLSARANATLSWPMRLRVALDAAKGLTYLHEEMDFQIIFRDLKTSNILIDENWNAKLSDFGLARQGLDEGLSHVSTAVVGTLGYAAPEYIQTGRLTAKSDIWSYGVVLYELITGRRPIDKNRPKGEQKLLEWVKPYISDIRRFRIIVDPRLEGNYNIKAVAKLASVANKCLVRLPKSRPKMSEVLEMVRVIVETFETGPPQPPLLSYDVAVTESKEREAKKKEFDWKRPFRNLKKLGGGHSKIVWRGWKLEIVEADT